MKIFAVSLVLGLAGLTSAHMEMKDPAPFRSKFNDFTTDVDYAMTNPLSVDGANFPCKGYHELAGTEQGKSVATWAPGSSQSMTITGGASHNGGSCQASLSMDGGSTWKVIHSYYGNCPVNGDSTYSFNVPNDTPAGEAIFAWTWFNKVGNREMYMNCAAVTIGGGSAKRDLLAIRSADDSFAGRPAMFVANAGNGCTTKEGVDVEFPNPGPDVTNQNANLGAPEGSCGGSGEVPAPEEPETPAPTTTTIPGGVFLTVPPVEVPTTLQTSVRPQPSAEPTEAPAPEQPETPAPEEPETPEAPETPETPEETEGAFNVGEACGNEGDWNCVDGSQFQRCASGQWSALIPVTAGTTCQKGVSSEILFARAKSSARIYTKSPAPNYNAVLRASLELAEKANKA